MNSTVEWASSVRGAFCALVLIASCLSGTRAAALGPCDETTNNPNDCEIAISLSGSTLQVVPENTLLPSGVAVTWARSDGDKKFKVKFKKCSPFNGKFDFDDVNYKSGAADPTKKIIVCKYVVKVGIHKVDPHIIVVSGSGGDTSATNKK